MRRLEVSPEADFEAEEILHRSAVEFGEAAAERYRRLVQAAYTVEIVRLLHDGMDLPSRLG